MRSGPVPDAATGLVLGWLADRGVGDPGRGHPVAGFGRLARSLERVAWRPARLPGVLYVTALAGAAGAAAGPLRWGGLAGPVGVAVHRAGNTLDAMVGYRNERYEDFGWASARLDDVLTWPAARLAACLAVFLAPVAGGDRSRAWATL